LLATFVAVYGWFITPISWSLALFIWGYALAAFFITDLVKVKLYSFLGHREA
jgi:H+-transporting ATPase